jgi:hypothetical protein
MPEARVLLNLPTAPLKSSANNGAEAAAFLRLQTSDSYKLHKGHQKGPVAKFGKDSLEFAKAVNDRLHLRRISTF